MVKTAKAKPFKLNNWEVLTQAEIVRQVVKRLNIDHHLKINWLQRRAIKPQSFSSQRHFRWCRRNTRSIINACVTDMNDIIADHDLDQLEEDYRAREGGCEAPIDMVFNLVNNHSFSESNNDFPLVPPWPRRTCTGYYGCTTSSEEVQFHDWEK